MVTKRWVRWVGAALVAALVAGCTSREAPPLRIGTNTWPGYEPLYLAQDIGQLNPKDARLARYPSATEVLKAFGAGEIDAAAVTLDEAMLLLAEGQDPCVVLVMDTSKGGDAIIARKEIHSVADLRGRRLGVEKTALGAYMASRAFQKAGIRASDVNIVNLPVDQHAAAFLGGTVDAVVTFEPVKSALLLAGGVDIFNSAAIPGEIVDVLVVRDDFADRYPDRVKEVLRSWFAALDYLKGQPTKAANFISMRLHLTPDAVIKSYAGLDFPGRDENRRLVIGNGGVPGLAQAATHLAETMRSLELLPGGVKPMRLFAPQGASHPLLSLGNERKS